jgi:hypothetical protein
MTIRHLFVFTVAGSTLFTGCMSSKEWVDDDVYVIKSVEIPTDTDISDETDYNAYVYNRRNNSAQTSYYSQFYFAPSYGFWMTRPGFYNDFGWIGNRGGYYGMSFYDPNYYNMFGYSYFYDPFWGYSTPYYPGYYGYPYGYGGYYGYGYDYGYYPGYGYGGNGGTVADHPHFTGPRGSIAGYGGVRSNSAQAYKSMPAGTITHNGGPARHMADAAKTVDKPVTSYDRVGRSGGAPSGRVVAGAGTSSPNNRPGAVVSRSSGPGTVSRATVPRPESTTARGVNREYSGGASPSRSGNSGGNYSGNGRNTGSYSNGGSTPRQSSGSSGTSGSSGSSRSGSSGGGTKTVGRR